MAVVLVERTGTYAVGTTGDVVVAGRRLRRRRILEVLGEIDYPEAGTGALAVGADGTWITGDGSTLTGWRLPG